MLAVLGLAVVSFVTVAPRQGEPAVVIFTDKPAPNEALSRVIRLGGRIVASGEADGVVYAAFDRVPGFRALWAEGALALLHAAGAGGCTGRAPETGLAVASMEI